MSVMQVRQIPPRVGFWSELGQMARRGRQAWGLVPWSRRLSLGAAVAVMCVTSAANTAIPLGLGTLVNAVNRDADLGRGRADLTRTALYYLAIIGLAYFVRETM